jgi:protein phosphatase
VIRAGKRDAGLAERGGRGARPTERPSPTIVVSDPSLVALIGAAGSGKTTFARRHFERSEVVGSDELRAIVSGDEADQSVSRTAFAILHRIVSQRLAAGRLVVVDATNVKGHARRALLDRARAAGVAAIAIVLDLPTSVILARNAARRERVVDPAVILDQLASLRASVAPGLLETEGFTAVHTITTPVDLDAVHVERQRGMP